MSHRIPFARRVPIGRRQLTHEPVKLVLALLGVALAVALVGLLFGLREGINRQVSTFEDNAGADVYVASKGTRDFPTSGSSTLPASLARQVSAVPGVAEAVPVTSSLGILTLHDKRVATLLVGFEPGRLGQPWDMAEGRRPRRAGRDRGRPRDGGRARTRHGRHGAGARTAPARGRLHRRDGRLDDAADLRHAADGERARGPGRQRALRARARSRSARRSPRASPRRFPRLNVMTTRASSERTTAS